MPFPKPTPRPKRVRGPIPRRRRPSPVRRTPRAAQERKLDALWRSVILAGSPLCWHCYGRATDAAHIVSRRYKATRWDRRNGLPLCRTCHDTFTRRPKEWIEVVAHRYPLMALDLATRALSGGRVDLAAAERELRGKG